jgi:hypothetical protein
MKTDNKKKLPPMEGLLPKLQSLPTDYRRHIVDVLGNHYMGRELTPSTIKLTVEFTRYQDTQYYRFSRFEENSTGLGMSEDTLVNEFFGVPKQRASNSASPPSFLSVHNLGEKLAETVLSKGVPSDLKGFEVMTKTEDSDYYLYAKFDTKEHEWIQNPTPITYDDAVEQQLDDMIAIMDRIGNKGTYSSYYINTESLTKKPTDISWYTKLIGYVETVFGGYLEETPTSFPIYDLTFMISDNHFLYESTKLKPKQFVFESSTKGSVSIGNKSFNYTVGKKPIADSKQLSDFDRDNPNRRALVAKDLIEGLARHAVVILRDKHTGYFYYLQKVPVGSNTWLERVVIIIDVEKDDLETDALKSRAHIKKADGTPISIIALHRDLIDNVAKNHYYMDGITETKIRNQLLKVLCGEVEIHPSLYRELIQDLDIPLSDDGDLKESYEYCKKYFQVEYPIEGIEKALDMINMDTKHVLELKIGEPNADDLNQILAYGFIHPNISRMTTFGISLDAKQPKKSNSNFDAVKIGKFSTDLNNHSQTKHIEWKLLDLRYYGLHVII